MPGSYVQNVVHLVFSTKNRGKFIPNGFRQRLWSYIGGVCKNLGVAVHAVGGVEDHIHLLVQVPPTISVAKVVGTIKANSSKWARESRREFGWQQGYGAFSVSASNVAAVTRYIREQEPHHRKMNFEAEFVALLRKHGVEFDEKYVFGQAPAERGALAGGA